MNRIGIIRIMFFFILISFFNLLNIRSENIEYNIYQIDIRKNIDWTSYIYLNKGLKEAQLLNVDLVFINLNTYGGLMEVADSMRTAILYSPIPVYAFIDNNAASAGALISVACKKIYMRKGASIGAASVVNQTGEIAPDKYQSYMRAMMRSTVEAHGKDTFICYGDTLLKWKRDPKIAEAMVDDKIIIPNLVDSGKTLTLTAEEALLWGYCDGIAESVDEVITKHLKYSAYKLIFYQSNWMDNLLGFLMHPVFQSILILIIIGGIYFELQTPGVGFPLAASVIAAIVYFSPLYLEGFAENWEILVFFLGIVLIVIEIFVLPGFGITGVSGIILVLAGFILSQLRNSYFNFEFVTEGEIWKAFFIVFVGLILGSVSVLWLSSRIGSPGPFSKISLEKDLADATTFPFQSELIGKKGVTITVLRPSGKVAINEQIYDAISYSGFIDKKTPVHVVRFENAQIYVEIASES